jgi:hypothetical protein
MAFFQVEAEHLLDERAEGYARIAEQPPGQFGVEEPPRPEADLGQAGQVLDAACSTASASSSAASTPDRSGQAIGSMSTVLSPARRAGPGSRCPYR